MKLTKYANQQYIDFLLAMTGKEIKVRYKNAIFGFLWMFLNPLLQMMIIGFIFQYFVKVKIDNYFVFLFAGLLPWNFFSYTITKNTPMMIFERNLLQKAKFPKEVLIVALMLANAFHLVVSLGLLLLVLLATIKVRSNNLLLVPLALVWIMSFTTGLSLMLTALNVRFRDVNFFIQAFIPLWFYATPIIYKLSILPKELQLWFYLNPLTGIIELFHLSLLAEPITNNGGIFISLGVSIFLVTMGIAVFIKESPFFVDWL